MKHQLSSEDELELLGLIEDYRQGLLPLIVRLKLLELHLDRNPVQDPVHRQVYFHPHPKELMLRNYLKRWLVIKWQKGQPCTADIVGA